MTAAESRLLTYAQAGARVPTANGKGKGVRFIRNAIERGDLVGVEFNSRCKRVSEFDLLQYIERSRTLRHNR